MAVVLTCVVVSVALWVLLCVSVCVLAGALKFPCVLYQYCWLSRRSVCLVTTKTCTLNKT